jgi:hypothetical protein
MKGNEAQKIHNLVAVILNWNRKGVDQSRAAYDELKEKYKEATPQEKEEIFEKVLDCLTNIKFDVSVE